MNKKMSKRQRDIKTKLMAAICMLLVSSIMMVSTTYAWFTLSTAPEVTGITTAVGANGNLEMALLPANGDVNSITSQSGDGADTKPIAEKNVTWGNLVDLSDNSVYGLENITLYPSELNLSDDGNTIMETPLKTPVYGVDGRVAKLEANTATAIYDEGFDANNSGFGVRAIGVSSGMSQRELDYKNALSAGNVAKNAAGNKAKQALEGNGTALASIAVKRGLGTDTFTQADVTALSTMITGLEAALEQIDTAYMQYILAYAASNQATEEVYTAIKFLVESSADLAAVEDGLSTAGLTLSTLPVANGIAAYKQTKSDVATAKAALPSGEEEYQWDDIDDVVNALANPTSMTVNNYTIDVIKDNPQTLIDSYLAEQKLTVAVPTGSGVFADIADQCGNYEAMVTISGVSYSGFNFNNLPAYMNIRTTMGTTYLTAVGTALDNKEPEADASGGDKTLTEMYGFIIDMAFRTNAANSDLQLQVDAVDRIYSDQTGADTMGHGSSMTFANISDDMIVTAEGQDRYGKVKNLMDAIRIVFFDPDKDAIIARAKLDTATATQDADGLTAKMYLYTTEEGVAQYVQKDYDATETGVTYYTKTMDYEAATGVTAENFANTPNLYTEAGGTYTLVVQGAQYDEDTTYYVQVETYEEATEPATAGTGTLYVKEITGAGENRVENNKIMGLTQNEATALSVLVYLDGNLVGNDDVAYSEAESMSGTLNLQFSSSATLVPMEYRALHQGTVEETTEAVNP